MTYASKMLTVVRELMLLGLIITVLNTAESTNAKVDKDCKRLG